MAKKTGENPEDSAPRYFDYLDEYGAELEERLETPGLVEDINRYRKLGAQGSSDVGFGCRRIIESIIRSYLCEDDENLRLVDLIEDLGEDDIVPRPVYCQLNEIRNKGNNAAHGKAFNDCDAKNCLECLDGFLRFLIKDLKIDTGIAESVQLGDDTVFVVRDEEVVKKAKLAADLSGDKKIVEEAKAVDDKAKSAEQRIEEGFQRLDMILGDIGTLVEESGGSKEVLEAKEKNLAKAEVAAEQLEKVVQNVIEQQDDILERADEIIGEHDFIARLLGGDSSATEEQLRVMAFPRTAGATTNVLRISGGAGTGKTLCLLAKLIMDVKADDQQSLLGNREKKALFVCFNTNLAKYTSDLIRKYPEECGNIDVVNYDSFVNQLVKFKTDTPGLSKYANDVRYPQGHRITYEQRYIEEAMDDVAKKHPNRANSYMLDSSVENNVRWVVDELAWLDARYEDSHSAEGYLAAARVGRGREHNPSAEYRKIILEVWQRHEEILERENLYTISQATKRLVESKSLPKYDAIAVDEAQDFAILSISLLLRMRRDDKSRLYISADENQKIYQRDFTWKELDSNVVSYTVTLSKNERNSEAIQAFADRLLGKGCDRDMCSRFIHVDQVDDKSRVISLVSKLLEKWPESTVALIGREKPWNQMLEDARLPLHAVKDGVLKPGVYRIGPYSNKGLEFDTVIVDLGAGHPGECTEEEKRLGYVHFTRARNRLYVRYEGEPPALLREYYSDFVE